MPDLPITIPKIAPPSIHVYYKGAYVGFFNEYELNDIRIQICKGKLEGFTVRAYEDEQYEESEIDIHGRLDKWPERLDLMTDQLRQIL